MTEKGGELGRERREGRERWILVMNIVEG